MAILAGGAKYPALVENNQLGTEFGSRAMWWGLPPPSPHTSVLEILGSHILL